MQTKKCTPLIYQMEKFIAASKSGRRRKPDGNRLAKGTITNYCNCLRLVKEFDNGSYASIEICTGLKMNQSFFRQRKLYWSRFYRNFSDFLYKRGYFDSYVSNLFKVVRTLLHWLHQYYGWLDYQFLPYNFIQTKFTSFEVLSPDQLKFLIADKSFNKTLTKSQRLIRNIMIVGCTTALRSSDLLNLRRKDIVKKEGRIWLVTNTRKTKQSVSVLLPDYVVEILKEYSGCKTFLLPRISNVNFNIGIEKLTEKAGWTYPIKKFKFKKGFPKSIVRENNLSGDIRFCDAMTTHTLRRSAITILLMMGMPETLVRQISGHKPGSREFYRYISVSQQWQDAEAVKVFNKISATPHL